MWWDMEVAKQLLTHERQCAKCNVYLENFIQSIEIENLISRHPRNKYQFVNKQTKRVKTQWHIRTLSEEMCHDQEVKQKRAQGGCLGTKSR